MILKNCDKNDDLFFFIYIFVIEKFTHIFGEKIRRLNDVRFGGETPRITSFKMHVAHALARPHNP